jgi:chromosome segregation ATPase
MAEQQEANRQAIAQNQQAIAQLTAEQQLSRQDISTLTASIQELRNLVADYIQGRSGT